MIKRGYTEGPFGQIHWRMIGEPTDAPDLICLHPAPYSGIVFETIMPLLSEGRRVVAPDYPGYGGSDAGATSIQAYAEAVCAVADAFSGGRAIDLLGFHTGCLVAADLCYRAAPRIRRAALIDCPSFELERRTKLLGAIEAFEPTPDLTCLETSWKMGVSKRLDAMPIERAFEMFVEMLRPGRNMNGAFKAAFSYSWEEVFPNVTTPTLVIATQSMLLDATRLAAARLPNASLVERLDIKRAVLDEAATQTSDEVLKFLNAR